MSISRRISPFLALGTLALTVISLPNSVAAEAPASRVEAQIHQALAVREPEEVDQLCAAGGFRRARQLPVASQAVDRARFSRIGAAREGDFPTTVFGALAELCRAGEELGMTVIGCGDGRRGAVICHR